MVLLASAMILSLASCGTKSDPSAGVSTAPAVSEQTDTQAPQTEVEAEVPQEPEEETDTQKSHPQPEAEVPQASEEDSDPVASGFNGLWITNSSIGTLYYFDNGEVTCYTNDYYDPSAPDLHYKIANKEAYVIEEVTSEDGSGYKAVLKSGNEYWLLDNYPDVLSCYFYDDNGELQLSGSSSLMRVTDFTVDDLILEDDPAAQDTSTETEAETFKSTASPSSYVDVVCDYVIKYGTLTFVNVDGYDYYIGVFQAKLIDFDQDGSDELLVGYSAPREDSEQYIPAPKLDVWTMENGVPVQAYEGAYVQHGDIASHCAYIDMDGKYYLCVGSSGYDMDLSLLSFENGSFTQSLNLKYYGDSSQYMINGAEADKDQWDELYQKIENNPDDHFHSGCLAPTSGSESKEALQEAFSEDFDLLGM